MSRNVLLITGDHVRPDALACNADGCGDQSLAGVIRTPNLDALARGGARFTNCFTPNPICVPARASITTGNYSHRALGTKDQRAEGGATIGPDQPKLAEHFARRGYMTYAIGKLHYLPYAPPGATRLLHGFRHAELSEEGRILRAHDPDGRLRGLEDYHDYLHEVGWGGYERAHALGNNDVHPAASIVPAEHHEEAWVAERAIAAIDRHGETRPAEPFLLWASFSKPHPPYDPPAPWDRMYDPHAMPDPLGSAGDDVMHDRDVELRSRRRFYSWDTLAPEALRVIRAFYCGLMSFQDAMVGRLLDHLHGAGLADDTVVVYTSDHGDLLGDFGRFFKQSMFDAAVKVPLIVRIPGGASGRRDQLVGLQDLFPSLCDAAGIERPLDIDGSSFVDIVADPTAAGRRAILSQCRGRPVQKYMLRTQEWKYVYTEAGGVQELYCVNGFGYELENLAGASEHADTVSALRRATVDWCREHADDEMLEDGELRRSDPDRLGPEELFRPSGFAWRKY